MNDAASAAPSDAELFPLIEKHFGMVPRRDDTVIDRRNGRFHDAQRYRDFAADLLSARAQPTPPAVVVPLTDEQIVGVMHSIPISENGSHCAVCGIQFSDKSKRSLDHCHETGKVRGFLCRRCNSVLGLVNDDQAILGKLAKYLGKHGK